MVSSGSVTSFSASPPPTLPRAGGYRPSARRSAAPPRAATPSVRRARAQVPPQGTGRERRGDEGACQRASQTDGLRLHGTTTRSTMAQAGQDLDVIPARFRKGLAATTTTSRRPCGVASVTKSMPARVAMAARGTTVTSRSPIGTCASTRRDEEISDLVDLDIATTRPFSICGKTLTNRPVSSGHRQASAARPIRA